MLAFGGLVKFPEGKVAAVGGGGGGGEGRGIGKILRGWDVVFIIEDSRFVYGGLVGTYAY